MQNFGENLKHNEGCNFCPIPWWQIRITCPDKFTTKDKTLAIADRLCDLTLKSTSTNQVLKYISSDISFHVSSVFNFLHWSFLVGWDSKFPSRHVWLRSKFNAIIKFKSGKSFISFLTWCSYQKQHLWNCERERFGLSNNDENFQNKTETKRAFLCCILHRNNNFESLGSLWTLPHLYRVSRSTPFCRHAEESKIENKLIFPTPFSCKGSKSRLHQQNIISIFFDVKGFESFNWV